MFAVELEAPLVLEGNYVPVFELCETCVVCREQSGAFGLVNLTAKVYFVLWNSVEFTGSSCRREQR